MDLRSRQWHEPTLKIFEIEGKMLADIKSNAEVYGQVKGGPLNGVQIAGLSHCHPSLTVMLHLPLTLQSNSLC